MRGGFPCISIVFGKQVETGGRSHFNHRNFAPRRQVPQFSGFSSQFLGLNEANLDS